MIRLRSLKARFIIGSVLWTLGLLGVSHLAFIYVTERVPHLLRIQHWTVIGVLALVFLLGGLSQVRRGMAPINDLRQRLLALREGSRAAARRRLPIGGAAARRRSECSPRSPRGGGGARAGQGRRPRARPQDPPRGARAGRGAGRAGGPHRTRREHPLRSGGHAPPGGLPSRAGTRGRVGRCAGCALPGRRFGRTRSAARWTGSTPIAASRSASRRRQACPWPLNGRTSTRCSGTCSTTRASGHARSSRWPRRRMAPERCWSSSRTMVRVSRKRCGRRCSIAGSARIDDRRFRSRPRHRSGPRRGIRRFDRPPPRVNRRAARGAAAAGRWWRGVGWGQVMPFVPFACRKPPETAQTA